jgi:hypothetical protein
MLLYIYIYIYIYIYTYTYIYIYIYIHTQRQASRSINHARPLVCSYGEMIATTTHETFAAIVRPQRKDHDTFYKYIHIHTNIYINTNTNTQREASKSINHARRLDFSNG